MQLLKSSSFNLSPQFLALVLIIAVLSGCGQTKTDTVANANDKASDFNEELVIPEFTIATINDSINFSSKSLPREGILLIKYFSPDCDHCQEEAKMYLSKKDSLRNVKTVWISGDWATLDAIKEFAEIYELEQLDPLAIGKETTNDLLAHYALSGIPFAAVYQNDQLIKEYRGALDFGELIAINNGTFTPELVATSSDKQESKSNEEN